MGPLFDVNYIDMAKRAGRVGAGRVNRVAGQTGRGLSWVASRVELTCIFQNIYIFF